MNSCLKNAQQNLCIQSVNLKESKIYVRDDVDLATFNRDAAQAQGFRFVARIKEITATDAEKKEIWDYRFIYSVGLRLIFSEEVEASKNAEYKPIVEIVGVFEARYLSKNKLSQDDLDEYTKDNVGYHVWPYWREYVQSTCARIGYSPAFEVPVYILSKKDNKESE